MKKLLTISVMIAIVATIFDLVYHLLLLPTPLSPPLYFITKFIVGFGVAFIILKITNFKNDIINSLAIGGAGAALFAILLQIPQYRIQVGVVDYGLVLHLAHGIAFFLGSYVILRYFEP